MVVETTRGGRSNHIPERRVRHVEGELVVVLAHHWTNECVGIYIKGVPLDSLTQYNTISSRAIHTRFSECVGARGDSLLKLQLLLCVVEQLEALRDVLRLECLVFEVHGDWNIEFTPSRFLVMVVVARERERERAGGKYNMRMMRST